MTAPENLIFFGQGIVLCSMPTALTVAAFVTVMLLLDVPFLYFAYVGVRDDDHSPAGLLDADASG